MSRRPTPTWTRPYRQTSPWLTTRPGRPPGTSDRVLHEMSHADAPDVAPPFRRGCPAGPPTYNRPSAGEPPAGPRSRGPPRAAAPVAGTPTREAPHVGPHLRPPVPRTVRA